VFINPWLFHPPLYRRQCSSAQQCSIHVVNLRWSSSAGCALCAESCPTSHQHLCWLNVLMSAFTSTYRLHNSCAPQMLSCARHSLVTYLPLLTGTVTLLKAPIDRLSLLLWNCRSPQSPIVPVNVVPVPIALTVHL
jgi:ferredoxin